MHLQSGLQRPPHILPHVIFSHLFLFFWTLFLLLFLFKLHTRCCFTELKVMAAWLSMSDPGCVGRWRYTAANYTLRRIMKWRVGLDVYQHVGLYVRPVLLSVSVRGGCAVGGAVDLCQIEFDSSGEDLIHRNLCV